MPQSHVQWTKVGMQTCMLVVRTADHGLTDVHDAKTFTEHAQQWKSDIEHP